MKHHHYLWIAVVVIGGYLAYEKFWAKKTG